MIFDVLFSVIGLAVFYKFYDKLHQDSISYFFLLLVLNLHNLGLYATNPLGIRFDHYMHFAAGFTIAIITDRIFNERLNKIKRFILLIVFSLGIGAVGEIVEWLGYSILGSGEGFFRYGVGDEGEWRNLIFDMVFNFFGSVAMAVPTLFRKN